MKRKSYGEILLGLATGTAFGFLLQKGGVSKYEAISGQLRFEDASVVKIMATASAVGALGTYALKEMELVDLKIKPLNAGGVLLGGTLFGAGMGLLGYCPGTNLAAIGEGNKAAAAGAVGMLGGALAYVKAYPHIEPIIKKGEIGEKTLPEMTGSSPWLWVAGFTGVVAAGAGLLNSEKSRKKNLLPGKRSQVMEIS
ncbi:MAG: YeeE/YedE thiosulfate transporter family protein [Desulfobulbaceae bacterium]|nr:YeeE/YedE thiosulfate transporter family protein [Desulfobulbaceae bacterium]